MAKQKITDIVSEALEPFLLENGYALFNVEYIKEVKDWYLRIYIDKQSEEEEYISIEDCEKVSRYLSAKLDELDPIEKEYYLEVSSPGIDRPLLTDEHFEKYKGRLVDVSLYKAIDGKKQLHGELIGIIDHNIVIANQKREKIEIPKDSASKVRLAVVF